jgi:hypothetical protein
VAGKFTHLINDETLASTKGRKFLDCVTKYQHVKDNYDALSSYVYEVCRCRNITDIQKMFLSHDTVAKNKTHRASGAHSCHCENFCLLGIKLCSPMKVS